MADPAENGTLCLDHLQRIFLEFREIRADTVFRDNALVTPIVSFANGRGDANFSGDAADNQRFDLDPPFPDSFCILS